MPSKISEYDKQVKKILEELEKLQEMAWRRDDWVDKVRDRYLGAALGEFAKMAIAIEIGVKDEWSNEVKKILSKVTKFMDEKRVKAKTPFDRLDALKEAMRESMIFQDQILDAKKEVMKYYPLLQKKIRRLDLESEDLFIKMIDKFLPEYSKLCREALE